MWMFLAESLVPEPQRQISLAGEIVLIFLAGGGVGILGFIAWVLKKIWSERTEIYRRIESIQEDVDARFDAGKERFAKIEQGLAEVKASLKTNEARTTDSNETIAKIEKKVDRLDERLDDVSVNTATTSAKVEQAAALVNRVAAEVSRFFTDSSPGRGITAKIKKAMREVVRQDALAKPEDTLYPEPAEDEMSAMAAGVPVGQKPKSAPTLQPVDNDTQEVPRLEPDQPKDRPTQPPTRKPGSPRPLMRKRDEPRGP